MGSLIAHRSDEAGPHLVTFELSKEGNAMTYGRVISLAAVAALGIACVASEALAARAVAGRGGAVAARGGAVGYRGGAVATRGVAYRGGAYRGGYYGGRYYRPGVAAAAVVGGAAVGAA